jgi:hypothetical protein
MIALGQRDGDALGFALGHLCCGWKPSRLRLLQPYGPSNVIQAEAAMGTFVDRVSIHPRISTLAYRHRVPFGLQFFLLFLEISLRLEVEPIKACRPVLKTIGNLGA